jgi:hypothetical protein
MLIVDCKVLKRFTLLLSLRANKLECLSLSSLYSLDLCVHVGPGAYPRVEQMKGAALG